MTDKKTLWKIIATWLVIALVYLGLPLTAYAEQWQNPANEVKELLGLYQGNEGRVLLREREGMLEMLYDEKGGEDEIKDYVAFSLQRIAGDDYRLIEDGLLDGHALVRFERDAEGRGIGCQVGDRQFLRHFYGPDKGQPFRIQSQLPLSMLKQMAAVEPPAEKGVFLQPDLVEIVTLDSTIKLDIRYATDNNFMGMALYDEPRAFLQRPAAEALVRVHQKLANYNYGLIIHDAYRPWYVTKIFWDATPDHQKQFVANPAKGSRHNRGGAVDVALYDRKTGQPIAMISGYDEFSPRAYADYLGGTSLERWQRDLLRTMLEEEGFTVCPEEWWHFDYHEWNRYPILNLPFNGIRNNTLTDRLPEAAASILNANQQPTFEEGVPFSSLELSQHVSQVVLVQSTRDDIQKGILSVWERVNNEWRSPFPKIEVMLGRNGLISPNNKVEGDKATPEGIYALKRAFGYAPLDGCKILYIQLSKDDFWVDDSASPLYNQLVKGQPVSGTYERMRRDDDAYKFGIVIEYNTEPIVKGKGSAIFMHVWRSPTTPTLGCVAMDEKNLIKIIKWLDPERQPVIILRK